MAKFIMHQLNEAEHLKTLFLWNSTARTRLLPRNQGTFGLYYCFVLRLATTNTECLSSSTLQSTKLRKGKCSLDLEK